MLKKALKIHLITIATLLLFATATAQESGYTPPKLLVNIIVGGMRSGDIERYKSVFDSDGFNLLSQKGISYTNAHYSSNQTSAPSSLATLMTGATPSTHGIVGEIWWDRLLGKQISLVEDPEVRGVNYNLRDYNYSAHRITAPTFGERLLYKRDSSRCISISIEPLHSIVLSSEEGTPYWIDSQSCEWGSSTAFMQELPQWIIDYNKSSQMTTITNERWTSRLPQSHYRNQFSTVLKARSENKKYESVNAPRTKDRVKQQRNIYHKLQHTPAGNRAIFDFAQQIVDHERLGQADNSDILNIYLSPSRHIAELYGTESVEVEDTYSQLDILIAEFLAQLNTTLKPEDIVIVLTSDGGISPSHDKYAEPRGRFDSKQFMVVVNSFLRVRYGGESWILGYNDRNLYLDHKEIFKRKLNLADIQNEVASFAMQFRGVSHALSAADLRGGSATGGFVEKMQLGFHPRYSGDVVLNLMPGWIEDNEKHRAGSGSTYRYDSHVPLIIYGEGYTINNIYTHEVRMESLAPTLSHILRIAPPLASESHALEEIIEQY